MRIDEMRHRHGDAPGGRQVEVFVRPVRVPSGPMTPVTTNWASGNRSPSMPMNGIEPPSPKVRVGWPNVAVDARSSASTNHGAMAGAFHPGPLSPSLNVTCAPYGGSASSTRLTAASAAVGIAGRREPEREFQRRARPQDVTGAGDPGRPSAPTTLSVASQCGRAVVPPGRRWPVLLRRRTGSGRRSHRSPRPWPGPRDAIAGVSPSSSGTRIAPVAASSTRSSSSRRS